MEHNYKVQAEGALQARRAALAAEASPGVESIRPPRAGRRARGHRLILETWPREFCFCCPSLKWISQQGLRGLLLRSGAPRLPFPRSWHVRLKPCGKSQQLLCLRDHLGRLGTEVWCSWGGVQGWRPEVGSERIGWQTWFTPQQLQGSLADGSQCTSEPPSSVFSWRAHSSLVGVTSTDCAPHKLVSDYPASSPG